MIGSDPMTKLRIYARGQLNDVPNEVLADQLEDLLKYIPKPATSSDDPGPAGAILALIESANRLRESDWGQELTSCGEKGQDDASQGG